MPRITTCGAALSTATKLYLITSTVATGVGGGFFCSQMLPHAIALAIVAPLSSKMAKLFLRLPYGGVTTPPQYFNKVGLRWARTHTPVEIS